MSLLMCPYCGEQYTDQLEHWAIRCAEAPRYVVNEARTQLRLSGGPDITHLPDPETVEVDPTRRFRAPRRREDHYQFAHRILPSKFFLERDRFLAELRQDGAAMLRRYWLLAGALASSGNQDAYDPELFKHLAVEVRPVEDGTSVALITLPPPREMTEAFFTAAAYHAITQVARYLTLEQSYRPDGTPLTILGEWTSEGTHVNYGDGPEPTLEAFFEAVCRRLRG